MSNSNGNSSSSFSHAFLPGLILGLILGAVAATFIPEMMNSNKIPNVTNSNGSSSGTDMPREREMTSEDEINQAIEDAQNQAEEVIDDAANTIEDAVDDAAENLPIDPPSDG